MALPMDPVVVAVDGSHRSQQAATWAATEARRHRARLTVFLVNDDPARIEHSGRVVADIAARCREAQPELIVSEEVATGHPTEEIAHRSTRAGLIVLGSRGHGGFVNALIGSVSVGVAMRASCPVVVVRGDAARTRGPVVVGVDGSPNSENALRFAFEAADHRQCELRAVQALPDAYFAPGSAPRPDRAELHERAGSLLAEQLAGWSETYPDVVPHPVSTNENAVTALRDAARGAELVVVGHHGWGGFADMLLGSVAHAVLYHVRCSVAVVRATEAENRQPTVDEAKSSTYS